MPGGRPPTWTDADDATLIQLHAEGHSLSECARRMNYGRHTVSRHAERLGLPWDREMTKAATDARREDNRARRAALNTAYLEDAERLREQLWKPLAYVAHGGKEFDRVDWEMDEPIPADKLKLMQASALAAQRSLDLERFDAERKAEHTRSLLGTLFDKLGVLPDESTDADG